VGFCGGGRCDNVCTDFSGHFLKWGKLFLVDQIKLGDKVVEVLVAGVDVWFCPDAHDPVEVVDIHVDKDPVEPRQDLFALWLETLGERDVCSHREKLLVIDLRLHPVHQEGDVLRSR